MSASYYSYWLIPQEPDLSYFQAIIHTLAKRFNTVPFSPHVTLHSGFLPASVEISQVLSALASIEPMELTISKLKHESCFSKTLYVHFNPSFQLSHLMERLVATISNAQPRPRDPHLSLLYHHLDTATKQTLIDAIVLPQTTIRFNQVQVIAASQNFETQAHVTSLRCIHSQLLTVS